MGTIFEPIEEKPPLNLRGRFKFSWVEDSLGLEETIYDKLNIAHTNSYLGKSITSKKIKLFLIIILVGLFGILCRVSYLQLIKGSYYRGLAEKNRIRLIAIPSERGILYDRFNMELVQNIPNFFLSIVPQGLPRDAAKRTLIIRRVAELSDLSEEDINKKLQKYQSSSYQSLVIKENLDYKTALELYSQNSDLPGILIENGFKRRYITSPSTNLNTSTKFFSLSPIIGYLGKVTDQEWEDLRQNNYLISDVIGKIGLEKTYESELRGTYGYKKIEVDALEREQNVLSVETPTPGKNLMLTIDAKAQEKLETIIRDFLERIHKKRAAAIALDPNTGEILALVNYPSFDNNDFSGGISSSTYKKYIEDPEHPLFNRAIGGTYPPGSTVKLVVAAAALQEKIINHNTSFNSTGGLQISRWFFPDWKVGGHGITNVTKAIAWSVNTFFYYIGGGYDNFSGLGVNKIVYYMSLFNLGQKTGIDIPGEQTGFVPSKEWKLNKKHETWFVGDTYNLSIGQGDLLVTPLQVAQWTSAVANGGKILQPHIVQKIVNVADKQESLIQPVIVRQNFIDHENMSIVKEGMRECVTTGSCKLLQNLPFRAAGKTGTAQWNKDKPNHAWFTAFAPYDNPRIVITVLVEEGGEGSATALPIADEFLKWWGKKYLTP